MKTQKYASLKWVLLLLLLSVKANASYFYASPLEEVCSFIGGGKSSILQEAQTQIKRSLGTESLTKDTCLQFEPSFRAGRIHLYYHKVSKRYLMVLLDIRKKVAEGGFSPPGYPEFQIKEHSVKMNDGIRIPTFVFQETTKQTAPVVVYQRSPYFHTNLGAFANGMYWAMQGFRFVIQPARGTFTAEGQLEWLDWKREREDARSTLDWIATQPWSTGKVAAFGLSYDGFLALATATTFHPTLVSAIALSGPWNPQTDSLSAGNSFSVAAEYIRQLNSMGRVSTQLAASSMAKLSAQTGSIKGVKQKLALLEGFDFKSIPENSEFPDNMDFIKELKKVSFLMIHGFGIAQDQDSRDTLYLYDHLKDLPNHYFVAHNMGHNEAPGKALLEDFVKSGASTAESFKAVASKKMQTHSCFMTDVASKSIYCSNSLQTLRPVKEQKFSLKDGYAWSLPKEGTVFGQAKLNFTLTIPPLKEARWLTIGLVFCPTDCKTSAQWEVMNVKLKEGTHQYEVRTQHRYHLAPAGSIIGLTFTETLYNGVRSTENIPMIVGATELTIPIEEKP